MKRQSSRAAVAALVSTLALCLFPTAHAADDADVGREAMALYDQGHYSQARPLLEQLDRDGSATGPLLYRLAYCQRVGGDADAAAATEARALSSLENELSSAQHIEVPFYLVNVYKNANRDADARRVAADATSRVDVVYSASAISTGHSVTSCAVRYSQGVWSPFASWLRSTVSLGTASPSARAVSPGSGSKLTIAIDGVGDRKCG